MIEKEYEVPVIMYHSIGVPNKNWIWNYLTCPFEAFEQQLIAIKEKGLTTISLNQLHDYMVKSKPIPSKSIVLTFDDGYADIWVFAYPLLKKYDMCGTVFINPEFVDKRGGFKTHYANNGQIDGLDGDGFLSWDEIKKMDEEGVVFSESHALTHTWYPISNKIIDFRHPEDSYTWMTWNGNTDLKHSLQIDNKTLANLGQPVYEHEKSLMAKKCFIDLKLEKHIVDYVANNGKEAFFNKKNWRDILTSQVEMYNEGNDFEPTYESDEDYFQRIEFELKSTKVILEEKLNRKITFLCWPGGSATKKGMEIALSLGYQLFNSARDMSKSQRKMIKNVQGGGIRVKRFTPLIYFNQEENFNSKIKYANKFWMKLYLYRFLNKPFSKVIFKFCTIVANAYYKKILKY